MMRGARTAWLTALTACGPGVLIIDDPVPSTDEPLPTVELPGFPEDIQFDFTPNPGQLTLEIFNGNSLYDYGFAATGESPIYAAEDCHFSGVCHPAGRTGVVLRVGNVVEPGSITAFREVAPERAEANVTHVVRDRLQDHCWVWGHDPSHYATLDCIVIDVDTEPPPVATPPTPTLPPEPTPAPPSFQVVLTDGDQQPDAGGIVDPDTLRLVITNGVGFYEFGYAQTAVGFNAWYGEDCYTGDFCHPALATGLTLTRVGSIGAIQPGATMLLPVDFPEAATPPLTYFVREVITDRCWVWGHDPAYYAPFNCNVGP